MRLERTFHPVGHGAFYTEKFISDEGKMEYCVVYDCGCFVAANDGVSIKDYKRRIDSIIDGCFPRKDNKPIVNALFLSHLHTDHILGVKHLCDVCDVKRIILPQLSELEQTDMYLASLSYLEEDDYEIVSVLLDSWETIQKKDPLFVLKGKENDETLNVNEEERSRFFIDSLIGKTSIPNGSIIDLSVEFLWSYIPFNSPVHKANLVRLSASLKQFPFINKNNSIDFDKLREFLKNNGITSIKSVYKSIFPLENEYSMTLLSGRPDSCKNNCEKKCHKAGDNQPRYCVLNCLYLGDYTVNEPGYWDGLWRYYGQRLKSVGLIQVPHHGSEKNYSDNLYCSSLPDKTNALNKVSIISADTDDGYGHPDKATLDGIRKNNGIPILVSEKSISKQCYNYLL